MVTAVNVPLKILPTALKTVYVPGSGSGETPVHDDGAANGFELPIVNDTGVMDEAWTFATTALTVIVPVALVEPL